MTRVVTFGFGGYCADCDESHDHPIHNVIEDIEIIEEPLTEEPEV